MGERTENKFEVAERLVANADYNVNFTLAITFTDIEAIKGQSVSHILYQLGELVERTIDTIEAECRRIGLTS